MRAYEQICELGRGGMGVVYLARARGAGGFEHLVVLKRLHAALTGDERAVKRFLNEARVAALIHHANVVGTHYVGQDESGYFLVLDYVEGLNLDELLKRALLAGQPLPISLMLRVALDALAGLSAVHDATDAAAKRLNLLHRDVSPHNLLLGRDGVTRLADFGIARSELGAATDRQYVVGKLAYLPREYLKREELLPRSDLYALGVTIWAALSGHEPWPDAEEVHVMRAILEDRIPPLSSYREVSPGLDALISRATEPEPELRFQSAREMAEAVEALAQQGEHIASAREVADFVSALAETELAERRSTVAAFVTRGGEPAEPRANGARPRRSLLRLGAALLLFGAVGAAAVLLTPGERAEEPSVPAPAPTAAPPPFASESVETSERAPSVEPVVASASAPSLAPAPSASAQKSAVGRARSAAGNRNEARGTAPRVPARIVTKNPYREE